MSTQNISKMLSTAAAVAFLTVSASPVFANEAQVKCFGVNSCKGTSACKTSMNACKAQNACKGHGFEMKTEAECKEMGGSTTEPTEK